MVAVIVTAMPTRQPRGAAASVTVCVPAGTGIATTGVVGVAEVDRPAIDPGAPVRLDAVGHDEVAGAPRADRGADLVPRVLSHDHLGRPAGGAWAGSVEHHGVGVERAVGEARDSPPRGGG